MVHYIFVYGTLRHDATHSMAGFLKKFASYVGPATVQGKMFLVETQRDFIYPALVFPKEESHAVTNVRGDVFRINDNVVEDKQKLEEVWKALDEYEGEEYTKEIRKVNMLDSGDTSSKEVEVNLYVYAAPTTGMKVIKNGDFLKRELE